MWVQWKSARLLSSGGVGTRCVLSSVDPWNIAPRHWGSFQCCIGNTFLSGKNYKNVECNWQLLIMNEFNGYPIQPFLIMYFFSDTIFQCLEVSPPPLWINYSKKCSLTPLGKVFVARPSVNTKLCKPQNLILTSTIYSLQECLELCLQFRCKSWCKLSKEKHRLLQIFTLRLTGTNLDSGET